jgi:hypothetical protein
MMKKPSSSVLVLIALWAIYGTVAVYFFYQAMGPLQRELVDLLGGFALLVVIGIALLFLPKRQRRVLDDDSPGSAEEQGSPRTASASKEPATGGAAGKPLAPSALVRHD